MRCLLREKGSGKAGNDTTLHISNVDVPGDLPFNLDMKNRNVEVTGNNLDSEINLRKC